MFQNEEFKYNPDAVERIMKFDGLTREEVLSLTNKEFVKYIKILKLRDELGTL